MKFLEVLDAQKSENDAVCENTLCRRYHDKFNYTASFLDIEAMEQTYALWVDPN
jgi:hypothetical protein